MAQTWNNLLNYIKRNLGAKLNLLELSDEEIVDGIKEDTLQYFSQYSPRKKGIVIGIDNKIISSDDYEISGQNITPNTYRIPFPEDEYVIDIFDVYSSSHDSHGDPFYGTKYSANSISGTIAHYGYGQVGVAGGAIIDAVISNQFIDMMRTLTVANTWEFHPPDIITFDLPIEYAVIIYLTVHENLDTIAPDMYNIVLKPLALGHVQQWLVALRSKYENLSTPAGEIQVNWQKLEQDSEKNVTSAVEKLEKLPHDKMLEIF
ncbi:MAG: hypothetical protein ACOC1O_02060 [bacterium]